MHKSKHKKASSKIAKRRKLRQYAGVFLKISVPTALLTGLIFLLRADFLQVKNFEVAGTEIIPQESLKKVAKSFITGSKFFVIPKSDIFTIYISW